MFDFPEYFDPEGHLIKSVATVRDLGVEIDNDGKFTTQIENSAKKGAQYAGWILRVFNTRQPLAMITLYKALVVPHLEYCCQLWSPTNLGRIRRLESVQRSLTAKIWGLADINYWERLKILNMFSLERRRERYLIVYTFKILSNISPNFVCDRFKVKASISDRRGRTCIIPPLNTRSPAAISSLIEQSFPVGGPRLFNAMPADLRNFDGSLEAFKIKLDKYLQKIPDQPCLAGYQQSAASNSIICQLAAMRAAGASPL